MDDETRRLVEAAEREGARRALHDAATAAAVEAAHHEQIRDGLTSHSPSRAVIATRGSVWRRAETMLRDRAHALEGDT